MLTARDGHGIGGDGDLPDLCIIFFIQHGIAFERQPQKDKNDQTEQTAEHNTKPLKELFHIISPSTNKMIRRG
jgi:hypothetical protein